MKYFLLLMSCMMFTSCKNLVLNTAFQAMGVYDDVAKMHVANSTTATIVLLPTRHLGTPQYYNNLHHKIDSLTALNYFFYTIVNAVRALLQFTTPCYCATPPSPHLIL